jgi:hypothetical protein
MIKRVTKRKGMTLVEILIATTCVAVLSIILLRIIIPIRIQVTRDTDILMAYKDALMTTSILERMYTQSDGMVHVIHMMQGSSLQPYIVFYTRSASQIWAICYQRGAVFGCGYMRGGGVEIRGQSVERVIENVHAEGIAKFVPLMSTRAHERMYEIDMSRTELQETKGGVFGAETMTASTSTSITTPTSTTTTQIAIVQSPLGVPIVLYANTFVMQFGLFPLVYLIY